MLVYKAWQRLSLHAAPCTDSQARFNFIILFTFINQNILILVQQIIIYVIIVIQWVDYGKLVKNLDTISDYRTKNTLHDVSTHNYAKL